MLMSPAVGMPGVVLGFSHVLPEKSDERVRAVVLAALSIQYDNVSFLRQDPFRSCDMLSVSPGWSSDSLTYSLRKNMQCSRSWDTPLLVQEVSLAEYLHWRKFLQYKPLRAREELSGGLVAF